MRFALVLVAAIATAGAQQTAAGARTGLEGGRHPHLACREARAVHRRPRLVLPDRTVKAGARVHVLDRGRPLAAFEPGGLARATSTGS
jgi:hypothetical protein